MNKVDMNSNIGSNKGKHTDYARLTSIFRKLDNELGADKKKVKPSKTTE